MRRVMHDEQSDATRSDAHFLRAAIRLSEQGMQKGAGGPFGCVVVRNGAIVGQGHNEVLASNDPTAHAEVVAIRRASAACGDFRLADCTLYTSCEPCPMCLGAIHWARIPRVVYAATRADAAAAGFDDDLLYREFALPLERRSLRLEPLLRAEAAPILRAWSQLPQRVPY